MFGGAKTYEEACRNFSWRVPAHYNIAADVCDRNAQRGLGDALLIVDKNLTVARHSYQELSTLSSKFANMLLANGHKRGDRILVLLKASLEAAVAHLGILKAGMITVPVFSTLTGEAVLSRLELCCASGAVASAGSLAALRSAQLDCPLLQRIYLVGEQDEDPDHRLLAALLEPAADRFEDPATAADDPALLVFTSGSEAAPKGVLHAQRMILGALPALELSHDAPREGEIMWAPADWGWLMGLNVALCSWWFGGVVLVYTGPAFNPDVAFAILSRFRVAHTSLPVTALRMMQLFGGAKGPFALRTITTGGEPVGRDLFQWARETMGAGLHELYAMTECASLTGNGSLSPGRPGSLGRPLPGHRVDIVDDEGNVLAAGEEGLIAVRMPDPAIFLRYWGDEEATRAKFLKGRFLTSDLAHQDEDGYLWYVGRSDDVIKSAGFRISPAVVEEAAKRHPAVQLAAAIGVPDAVRGQVVKLWVQLRPGELPSALLGRNILEALRSELSAHEWPREIAFEPALPVTANGKVARRDLRARA